VRDPARCARCGRRFDAPGLGRGYGAALQTGGGAAVHYPACATPGEIEEVGRRIEALRKAKGAAR
jgi:hypothetical protein